MSEKLEWNFKLLRAIIQQTEGGKCTQNFVDQDMQPTTSYFLMARNSQAAAVQAMMLEPLSSLNKMGEVWNQEKLKKLMESHNLTRGA
jgi:hypothetical protein